MIERWSEPGLGEHIVESLQLEIEDDGEFFRIQKEITELDSYLKKYGMKVSLSSGRNEKYTFKLDIAVDRLKRDAGKKRDYGSAKKVSDIFLYSNSHKSTEAAEYAGVQLRTYQRRVKKYKEENRWNEENTSFF